MNDFQTSGCGDKKEARGLAIKLHLHQRACVDLVIHRKIWQRERLENSDGVGKLDDLPRLTSREVGRFQTAGVILPFRLAARVGGSGMGFHGRIGEALKLRAKLGADSGKQFGFHQRAASLARNRVGCQACVMLTVYCYQKCSTCRDALKWLDGRGLTYQVKAIRETPPTPAELATALKAMGGDLQKIFNTSGMDYRALGLKDQLPAMSETAAFELLSKNGNLLKRPFLIGDGKVLVGFKVPEWKKALS